MDPERLRAYLQVACAGLGFDIGEIWRSLSDNGAASALAAIEEQHDDSNALTREDGRKLRFVQLYTSKSFEDRRNQLVRPADEEENYNDLVNGGKEDEHEDSKADLQKHVLSPLLVDAISKTAQVVWAHTKKQEGLTGRSDMRLQTAVGMPVAVDDSGNMCVVVMFSPHNIRSTDDAMEYLQSISQGATSTSIPSLLPAFDPSQGVVSVPNKQNPNSSVPLLSPCLTDGVETRFVALDKALAGTENALSVPEVHSDHDLVTAPKDCFGIPMLPRVAELGGTGRSNVAPPGTEDAFDEASYGVWSTIMANTDDERPNGAQKLPPTGPINDATETPIYAMNKPEMVRERRERLEEFASAFLDVSVFDFCEVWIPIGGDSDLLGQVTAVYSSESKSNQALTEFNTQGERVLIKCWSGAIGRAFSSGNPVWSTNRDVFADSGRKKLFSQLPIQTALAVPVFSGKRDTVPSFVFCCYAFVRTGSVPFVLKFVQQALKLLWSGLDQVQPHLNARRGWKNVGPADLGVMAADVEMQEHFMIKKRPHGAMSTQIEMEDVEPSLAYHIDDNKSSALAVRSIYTGPPVLDTRESPSDEVQAAPAPIHTFDAVGSTLQEAVKSIGDMKPVHHHVTTNSQGSKRAHVLSPVNDCGGTTFQPVSVYGSSADKQGPISVGITNSRTPAPLAMPRQLGSPGQFPKSSMGPMTIQPLAPQQYASISVPFQPVQGGNSQSGIQSQPPGSHVVAATNPHAPVVSVPTIGEGTQYQYPQPASLDTPSEHTQSNPLNDYQQQSTTQHSTHQPKEPLQSQVVYQSQPVYYQQQTPAQQPQAPPPLQQQHPMHSVEYSQSSIIAPPPPPAHQTYMSHQPPSVSAPMTAQISANGIAFPPVSIPETTIGNSHAAAIRPNVPVNYCLPITSPAVVAASPTTTMTGGAPVHANINHSSGKLCRIQGCHDVAVTRRPYCVRHSGPNRMCEHPTCGKCAQGSTRFCIAHGGGRRCTFPGCDKGARDKFFCAAHGGGKRCKHEGCTKSAVGGSNLCTAHGGGRRCSVQGCDKSAQSSTQFCVKHGGGKKCSHVGCEKVARGRTPFCASHGGGVRCKLDGCNRVAIGKLQLCRTHGGGAGPSKQGPSPTIPQPQTMGFADMTSI